MKHAPVVRRGERIENLVRDGGDFARLQPGGGSAKALLERLSPEPFHDEKCRICLAVAGVEDPHDAGMADAGRDHCLAKELTTEGDVIRKLRMKALDCDSAVLLHVHRFENGSRRTRTQQSAQPIAVCQDPFGGSFGRLDLQRQWRRSVRRIPLHSYLLGHHDHERLSKPRAIASENPVRAVQRAFNGGSVHGQEREYDPRSKCAKAARLASDAERGEG